MIDTRLASCAARWVAVTTSSLSGFIQTYKTADSRAGAAVHHFIRCLGLLLTFSRRGRLGLAGLGKTKLLMLNALPLEQGRDSPGGDSARVEPVTASVHLQEDLLRLVFVRG